MVDLCRSWKSLLQLMSAKELKSPYKTWHRYSTPAYMCFSHKQFSFPIKHVINLKTNSSVDGGISMHPSVVLDSVIKGFAAFSAAAPDCFCPPNTRGQALISSSEPAELALGSRVSGGPGSPPLGCVLSSFYKGPERRLIIHSACESIKMDTKISLSVNYGWSRRIKMYVIRNPWNNSWSCKFQITTSHSTYYEHLISTRHD